ncbi:hypothetical protein [Allokutzneria multivorans]|uniref:hypothetical protein n=1 Tax=Allokutzneria multivorans TaxID=1142134 RepID=UPI0031E55C79
MNHDANRPFRWDLVRPDQLGTLLDGTRPPDLWFLDELIDCAAKVLARSGDGEIYFVGRSADSVFDFLSGALAGTDWAQRLHQLPMSLGAVNTWMGQLDQQETERLRANMSASGLTPHRLARGRRPAVFVDIVSSGGTYECLYGELRRWISDEREAWDVVRRKLRFLGLTCRKQTSPNTFRWQQHAEWTEEIPASAIGNVSVDAGVYSYFADRQTKLTPSFARWSWADPNVATPDHGQRTRQALAEAVALVEAGRNNRDRLVKVIVAEPTFAEPWLRSAVNQLR